MDSREGNVGKRLVTLGTPNTLTTLTVLPYITILHNIFYTINLLSGKGSMCPSTSSCPTHACRHPKFSVEIRPEAFGTIKGSILVGLDSPSVSGFQFSYFTSLRYASRFLLI